MGNRSGGIRSDKGMDNNIYFNQAAANLLMQKLSLHFPARVTKILDACAGRGALGEAIYDYYRKNGDCKTVEYQDIAYKERDDKKIPGSILDYKPDYKYDIIVANGPFSPVTLALDIYGHLMSLLNENGVLFFVINNTFMYQGWERGRGLNYSKSYYLPRYIFDTKESKAKKNARTLERFKKKGKEEGWNETKINYEASKVTDTVLTDVSVMVCPEYCKTNNFIHIPREIVK